MSSSRTYAQKVSLDLCTGPVWLKNGKWDSGQDVGGHPRGFWKHRQGINEIDPSQIKGTLCSDTSSIE